MHMLTEWAHLGFGNSKVSTLWLFFHGCAWGLCVAFWGVVVDLLWAFGI